MKFYTSHQIAIHSAIADAGYSKDQFSFSKKKGRIIISRTDVEDVFFSFIEKRESTLDPVKMRVMDKFSYFISENGAKEELVDNWDEVLSKFNSWLIN